MTLWVKYDMFQIVERKDGAIFRTKKVAFHWFRMGCGPDVDKPVSAELVAQNGLPAGEYFYTYTGDYTSDSRCPRGGLYKQPK